MKEYVLKIAKNETILINIRNSKEIFVFNGVAKIMIDNFEKNKDQIIELILKKYGDVSKEKVLKDYLNFVNQLNTLNFNKNNVENIIKVNSKSKILSASIEITSACSFKCDHCYVLKENTYMDFDTYKKIINELVELGCNDLLLTGGEPMLHKNFIEIYLYAKKMGLIVNINTNLSLMNDHILETFKLYKPGIIEISVYGYDDNSYEEFTHFSKGFQIVDENINKLLKSNININLKTVLTKKSKNYIAKIKNYAIGLNVPFRYDYIIFPKLDSTLPNPERCSPKEIIDVLKNDIDAVYLYKNRINNMKKIKINNYIFQCEIGKNRIFISANLDIRPCLVVPIKQNYNDVNINGAFDKFAAEITNYKFQKDSKCKKCIKKSVCRNCPGRFYMESGSFEIVPNFYCDLADKIIKEFK